MTTWRTKLFGDNRMNFYGWIGAGLLAIGMSFYIVVAAARAPGVHSATSLLLLALYVVLVAHFGLALQNYHARVAEKLDAQREQEDDRRGA